MESVKVWTVSAEDEDDADIIDDAALLSEEDLKRPVSCAVPWRLSISGDLTDPLPPLPDYSSQ